MTEDTAIVSLTKVCDSAAEAGMFADHMEGYIGGLTVGECITRTDYGKWQVTLYAQGELIEAWEANVW